MKKIILVLCLLLLPVLALAAPTWRITELDMDNLNRPTGAFCYEDALFTSNQGSGPGKNDGFILRYNLEDYAETVFLQDQLYDPKGFAIVRNYILLIDQNLDGEGPGLILADLRKDKILTKTKIAQADDLYGVTALNSSNFVVTDRGKNMLFTVTADMDLNLTVTPWVMDIFEASGVCLHDSFIYAAGSALDEKTQQTKSGSIYQIDPFTTVTQRFVTLTQTNTGYLNALTGHRGYLFAGDWAGQDQEAAAVYVISTSSKRRVAKIDVPLGVTDIAAWDSALYLPAPRQNKVIRIEIDFESLGR